MAASDWVPVEEKGWGDYLAEGARDFARAGVNAATFGMADRAVAGLTSASSGRSYDEELAKNVADSEAARERSPVASVAGDVAGAVALPGFGAAKLAGATTRALGSAIPRGAATIGGAAGYGLTGAGVGAAQGAGNTYTGNPWDYAENALKGFGLGGAFGAAGGAAFGRPRPAVSKAEIPTTAQTEGEKIVTYRQLDNSPARYTPASFADRASGLEQRMRHEGYFDAPSGDGGSPRTFRAIDRMLDPPTARDPLTGANTHLSPQDIDTTRKVITGKRMAGASGTDANSAAIVRRNIDDFIRNPPKGAVVPGTEPWAREASGLLDKAHGLNSAWKRQQFMDEVLANARRAGGSKYSGLNFQNEVRNAFKNKLAEKDGASQFSKAGFNRAETDAIDKFVMGSTGNNVMRIVDRVLGGGGGLGAAVTFGIPVASAGGGYLKDNPEAGTALGLGAAGLGHALRRIGNRRAFRDVKQLNEMIAKRNPLYADRVATAGMRAVPPVSSRAAQAARDAAALVLLNQLRHRPEAEDKWE